MRRIVLILMLLGALQAHSQKLYIPGIGGVSVPTLDSSIDSVDVSNTIVQNLDSVNSFSDNVTVHFAIRDVLGVPQHMYQINIGFYNIDTLDQIIVPTITVQIDHSYFQDGNNTVVIWPACPGIMTVDSLEYDITYNSINEIIDNEIDVFVGPNPASDKLFLGDPGNLVKQVRFRTAEGKLVGVATTNTILDLNLGSGVYIIELETADKKTYTRKLIVRR